MAPKKKAQRTIDVWKKKKWYKILAPSIFNNDVVGETPSLDHNLLIGRTIAVNLMNLTRDMKKQNINIVFEIDRVQGDSGYTHIKKYEIIPTFLKRAVRRDRNRIDDSFTCKSSDGWTFKIKPFILTKSSTKKSVNTKIRKKIKDLLISTFTKSSKEGIIKDIIFAKTQKFMREAIANIYPVRSCEIRVLEVIGKGGGKEENETAAEQPAGDAEAPKPREEKAKPEKKEPKKEKPKKEENKEEKIETEENKEVKEEKKQD